MKKKKTFKCPHCKEELDVVIQWQTVSIAWEFNFETGDSEEVDRSGNGDHESFMCPECGKELDDNESEIRELLDW